MRLHFTSFLEGVKLPSKKELSNPVWVWENRSRLAATLKFARRDQARLEEIVDYLVNVRCRKPWFSKKYKKHFFKGSNNSCGCVYYDLKELRYAEVYLNAHDEVHYGVNLTFADKGQHHVGHMFTKKQATAIALAWVCNNEVLSVKGKDE